MITKKQQFKSKPVPSSEITPEHVYMNRREFMQAAGIVGAGALLASACSSLGVDTQATQPPDLVTSATTDELGASLTPYTDITNYNNYYEFSLDKELVAPRSISFKASPWSVEVYGLVETSKTFTTEDLLSQFDQEERIYRLRCVEAWSMVIPWTGFSLSHLLNQVKPLSTAKFVRFETVLRPEEMPGQRDRSFPWPYQEGLRLDEAMHDLTILATGLYGKPLPNQDGAPVRLVVPWKYGFKSIKAITKIELVDTMPSTLWSTVAPDEYGFYANVNPNVSHPRWTQDTERRIGELKRIPTLMLNGYEADVAGLYAGMDLSKDY
jgi:sulfoxide reductase catalytic subunit YedY